MKKAYSHKVGYVEIDWTPDKESEFPIYKQIINFVSDRIQCGDWAIGLKLPSQRQLAMLFQVNRSTIVSAMDELISYGILESEYGGGTRIVSNTWSLMMSAPPNWNKYVAAGSFRANLDTIQTINKLEFDKNYIRLGTGELSPKLFPEKLVKKAMLQLSDKLDSLNYIEPLGMKELREVLAERLCRRGIKAKPSNILITSGSLQALQLISICMLKSSSKVFIESPSYLKSLQVFQSVGIQLVGVKMDKEGILPWKVSKSNEANAEDFSMLYTIPNFHNPTGTVMSKQRRVELFEHCQRKRIPILEDDAYGELWFEEAPPLSLKSMDENGMVLYLGTVSKTLAPGLRIGWVVGPETVIARLGDVKMQIDYGASSMSQLIVNEMFRNGDYDRYLSELRVELRKRRDYALGLLGKYFSEHADWCIPEGGFYIWLKLKMPISTEVLFKRALQLKLLLNPGLVYDEVDNHALRISYAYAEYEQLRKGLLELAEIIKIMQ